MIMDIKFSADGLIDGGIECTFQRDGKPHQHETVYDLISWITEQFVGLHNESEQRYQAGEKRPFSSGHIWIGESVMPFVAIWATRSKFTVALIHPEHWNQDGWFIESTDAEKVSEIVANKMLKTKNIAWDKWNSSAPQD